jgi:glycosyltransferase involved in cell wall biosynthesis
LRSLLSQNILKERFEVIVVDDASTDDSLSVIQPFLEHIRFFQNTNNIGLGATSNVGIRNSRGRFIVRVDSDDYVNDSFLRTLLMGFEFFGRDYQGIATDYLNVTPEGSVISYGDSQIEPIACSIAFKMDAIEALGFYDEKLRFGEDVDLRRRFENANFKIRNINLPLYRYVRHQNSLTRSVLI